jgi:hypothetical protein
LAGTPIRSQDNGIYYWATHPGFQGNIHLFIEPGTLDEKFYLNPNGGTDEDMNVHHWAWGVAIGYNFGTFPGEQINLFRELGAVQFDVNDVNLSDLYIGSAGIYTGNDLWYFWNNPSDISSLMYSHLK